MSGLTQADMGRRLYKTERTISRWECGALPSHPAMVQLRDWVVSQRDHVLLLTADEQQALYDHGLL